MKIKEFNRPSLAIWSNDTGLCAPTLATLSRYDPVNTSLERPILELYDFDTRQSDLVTKPKWTIEVPFSSTCAARASSTTSKLLIAGSAKGSLVILDLADHSSSFNNDQIDSPNLVHTIRDSVHTGPVRSIDCNRFQTNLLASVADQSELFIWDVNKMDQQMTPGNNKLPHKESLTQVRWNPRVQHILATTSANHCVIWDLRKSDPVIQLTNTVCQFEPHLLAWSPDVATRLCLCDPNHPNGNVELWDLRFAKHMLALLGHWPPPATANGALGNAANVNGLAWAPTECDSDLVAVYLSANGPLPTTDGRVGSTLEPTNADFLVVWSVNEALRGTQQQQDVSNCQPLFIGRLDDVTEDSTDTFAVDESSTFSVSPSSVQWLTACPNLVSVTQSDGVTSLLSLDTGLTDCDVGRRRSWDASRSNDVSQRQRLTSLKKVTEAFASGTSLSPTTPNDMGVDSIVNSQQLQPIPRLRIAPRWNKRPCGAYFGACLNQPDCDKTALLDQLGFGSPSTVQSAALRSRLLTSNESIDRLGLPMACQAGQLCSIVCADLDGLVQSWNLTCASGSIGTADAHLVDALLPIVMQLLLTASFNNNLTQLTWLPDRPLNPGNLVCTLAYWLAQSSDAFSLCLNLLASVDTTVNNASNGELIDLQHRLLVASSKRPNLPAFQCPYQHIECHSCSFAGIRGGDVVGAVSQTSRQAPPPLSSYASTHHSAISSAGLVHSRRPLDPSSSVAMQHPAMPCFPSLSSYPTTAPPYNASPLLPPPPLNSSNGHPSGSFVPPPPPIPNVLPAPTSSSRMDIHPPPSQPISYNRIIPSNPNPIQSASTQPRPAAKPVVDRAWNDPPWIATKSTLEPATAARPSATNSFYNPADYLPDPSTAPPPSKSILHYPGAVRPPTTFQQPVMAHQPFLGWINPQQQPSRPLSNCPPPNNHQWQAGPSQLCQWPPAQPLATLTAPVLQPQTNDQSARSSLSLSTELDPIKQGLTRLLDRCREVGGKDYQVKLGSIEQGLASLLQPSFQLSNQAKYCLSECVGAVNCNNFPLALNHVNLLIQSAADSDQIHLFAPSLKMLVQTASKLLLA